MLKRWREGGRQYHRFGRFTGANGYWILCTSFAAVPELPRECTMNLNTVSKAWSISAVMLFSVNLSSGQGASPTEPAEEERIVLSPFTVTSESDQGYRATDTLAGTRLKTNLR